MKQFLPISLQFKDFELMKINKLIDFNCFLQIVDIRNDEMWLQSSRVVIFYKWNLCEIPEYSDSIRFISSFSSVAQIIWNII